MNLLLDLWHGWVAGPPGVRNFPGTLGECLHADVLQAPGQEFLVASVLVVAHPIPVFVAVFSLIIFLIVAEPPFFPRIASIPCRGDEVLVHFFEFPSQSHFGI